MRRIPTPVCIDYETRGIEGRPHYPPKPVGVSIKYKGKKANYYAFDHDQGNNCTKAEAKAAVKEAYKNPEGVVFQNGKFDLDVAETHFKLKPPIWHQIHDTMFLLFLDDPNQKKLGLKESAERLLNLPPEEKDIVCDWLVENQPIPGVKISPSPKSDHYFMKYLQHCPGDIVGKYANGDVERTEKLFRLLYPRIVAQGMKEAYDRERKLLLPLLAMERKGLLVDHLKLKKDVKKYLKVFSDVDECIQEKLKTHKDPINIDSSVELMTALVNARFVDESKLQLTPKSGKIKSNKEAIEEAVKNKTIKALLLYRSQLKTFLRTFMIPWLNTCEKSGGYIFTTWNQVKSYQGKDSAGARTGRFSSHPNFMNLPKEQQPIFAEHASGNTRGMSKSPIKGLPPVPKVREYIKCPPGYVMVDRDYSQQEPRLLGHFENGVLTKLYSDNPWIDFHDLAQKELRIRGRNYTRGQVKNINLGLIYGMGVKRLAKKTGLTVQETKGLKKAVLLMYPGLKEMFEVMEYRAAVGEPFTTWGGRVYYCEPPLITKEGKSIKYDYKMVNTLIQGSAADQIKEALVRFFEYVDVKKKDWHVILQVHDQITVIAPRTEYEDCMRVLRQIMESIECDVPMLSEGKISFTNWGALKDYDKKGELV